MEPGRKAKVRARARDLDAAEAVLANREPGVRGVKGKALATDAVRAGGKAPDRVREIVPDKAITGKPKEPSRARARMTSHLHEP